MTKLTSYFLMLLFAVAPTSGIAQPLPPPLTQSIFKTFNEANGNYDHSAFFVTISESETSSELLDAKFKCFTYQTQWAGVYAAWNFNLVAAYEISLKRAPWSNLQAILRHLPAIHETFCAPPLPIAPPSVVDFAHTLFSLIRVPFASAITLNEVSSFAVRVVTDSINTFRPTNIGPMVTHIGGTILFRPSLRPNENHLKVCTWQQNLFHAPFPRSVDPTLYENRRMCQILSQSIYNNVPFLTATNTSAIPENPF